MPETRIYDNNQKIAEIPEDGTTTVNIRKKLSDKTLIAKKDAGAPIGKFVKEILIPCVLTVMISYIITSQIVVAINVPIVKLFVSTIVSFISITLCASTFCLKSWEKEKLKGLMINLKSKFFRR